MGELVERLRAFADIEEHGGTCDLQFALSPCREAADRIEALEARCESLAEALVQHNDCLRSAQQIAYREGADTNWLSFRGQCAYTLAEYHELVNECRAALGGT